MVFVTQVFCFAFQTLVSAEKTYYGSEFHNSVLENSKDAQLKESLKKILRSIHIRNPNGFDQIVEKCESKGGCYSQTSLGYNAARSFLFGHFYLIKVDAGNYGITEMYCNRVYQTSDFGDGGRPGPGITPDSTVINTEHTWPQSRFTGRYPKDLQKADLHHLFPTDSRMNSIRGNTIFGEVSKDVGTLVCNASRFGTGTAGSREIFEPADNHKGRVARALFYFSVRYDLAITQEEEVVLKKWNQEHPVDAQEITRNEEIYKRQGNRNPFIDYPQLAQKISDF